MRHIPFLIALGVSSLVAAAALIGGRAVEHRPWDGLPVLTVFASLFATALVASVRRGRGVAVPIAAVTGAGVACAMAWAQLDRSAILPWHFGCRPLRYGYADVLLRDEAPLLLGGTMLVALLSGFLAAWLPERAWRDVARLVVSSAAALSMLAVARASWAPEPEDWLASLPSTPLFVDGPPRDWVPHAELAASVARERKLRGGRPFEVTYEPLVDASGSSPVPGWFLARQCGDYVCDFAGNRHPLREGAWIRSMGATPGARFGPEDRLALHQDAQHGLWVLTADGEPQVAVWPDPEEVWDGRDMALGLRLHRRNTLMWSAIGGGLSPPHAWIAAAAVGTLAGALSIVLSARARTNEGRRAALAWATVVAASLSGPLAVAAVRGLVLP